uniref:Ku domain-containing protein n=1 Tax=Clastoptera arizonana TaxID=38151 RepID=A0A1B6C2S3_9HEMI
MANISYQTFIKSPCHFLIIDIGDPMIEDFMENIKKAVKNILILSNSFQEYSRILCFGLALISNNFQPVIKITSVNENCISLLNQIDSVCMMQMKEQITILTEFKDFLHYALVAVLNEFQEYYKSMDSKDLETLSQLQITLITAKNGNELHSWVKAFLQNLNIFKLKKVQILEIRQDNEQVLNIRPSTNDFVQSIKINGSQETLDNFFKSWLIDYNKDKINAIIKLPNLLLKCDMVECLIDVNHFSVSPNTKSKIYNEEKSLTVYEVPFYEFEITNRLSSGGLDESLLFGQPMGLIPTQCILIDTLQLKVNMQQFLGVCENLNLNQEYLIAKVITPKDLLSKYFVLLPGAGMFLVKSIATSEFVLPSAIDTKIDQIPQTTVKRINDCLKEIKKLEEYDVANFKSDLYNSLNVLRSLKKKKVSRCKFTVSSKTETSQPNSEIEEKKKNTAMSKYIMKNKMKKHPRKSLK